MPFHRATPRPTHDLALLVVVLVWGVNFPIVKHALTVMHPFALNVFRFLVSTLTMGAIVWSRSGGDRTGIQEMFRQHALRIIVLGLIGTLFYQWFFILGIARTTSGTAALIMASAPAWTILVSHFRGYEASGRTTVIGLAASLLGTALIVFAGHDRISFSNETLAGNVLILGASVMWGTYTALARPTSRYIPPLELSFVGLLVAMPFLLALGAPHFSTIIWADVTPGIWLSIFYSGALSTGLAVVVWNVSVKHAGANYTALFGNLVPIVALATGAIFLDEPITWIQLVGGAMAIGGLLLIRMHGTQAHAEKRGEAAA